MRHIFGGLLFLFMVVAYADLLPTEVRIKNHVVAHQQAQLAFLKKITLVNSGTSNHRGVMQVGEMLRPDLAALGFRTHWVYEPATFNRAPTLVAEHPGKRGKRLLLIGHLDTVFAANTPFKEFATNDTRAKGPGVVDDKGGLVIILYALKALQAAHVLNDASITVVLTGDEEDSGKPASISRKPLVDAARHSDVALDFEEAVSLDTASIARRGISAWSLAVRGNEAHSSTIFRPQVGAGAIFEMARILDTMRLELQTYKNVTYSPGLIFGGTRAEYDPHNSTGKAFGKTNVIAQIALAKGDFRYLSIDERERIKDKMRAIVTQHLPGTSAKIEFQDGIPAMSPTQSNLALLKQYSKVSEDLGQGKLSVLDPNDRGAGDISYVANIVPANLVGLGPMGWDTHSVNETLYLKSLPVQTMRAALLLHRLSQMI